MAVADVAMEVGGEDGASTRAGGSEGGGSDSADANAVPAHLPAESKMRARVAPLLNGPPMKRELEPPSGTFYTPLRRTKKAKGSSPTSGNNAKPIEEAFESWFILD